MKRTTVGLVTVAAATLMMGITFAQRPGDRGEKPRDGDKRANNRDRRPGDRDGRPRGREGRRRDGDRREGDRRDGRRGPGNFRPPMPPPLLKALDADGDGQISAKEIENAALALKSLDKNKDGKLTRDELRPERGRGRPGFDRPRGDRRRGGEGRPDGARRRGGQGRQGQRGPRRSDFIKRIFEHDKNKDGKLTKDELPERMQRIFQIADANEDGALDKAELEKMAERFRNRRGRGNRPRDGRPDGKKRGDSKRPQRPDAE